MKGYNQNPKFGDTVKINGVQTYYEVYGDGSPLFFLHGFTQSSKSWVPFISDYVDEFEVYLVDLMGHGRSDPFTENISVKDAAIQFEALLKHLGFNEMKAIGYSYGGEILFQLTLLNPGLVSSMIIVGSCGSWNAADYPGFVEYLSYKNVDNLPWMREQQVSEEQIKNILEQFPNYKVQLSDEELKSIHTKTLIVVGDNDPVTSLDCAIKAKQSMSNAHLWVVPNTGHLIFRSVYKDTFVNISKDFFTSDSWD